MGLNRNPLSLGFPTITYPQQPVKLQRLPRHLKSVKLLVANLDNKGADPTFVLFLVIVLVNVTPIACTSLFWSF